ncbi:MAG: hypothetical protein CVV25_07225 [Ignavibacteriae bacterium HGW-Ignavibacteriae-4]|jgi:hypothetical protein|nr:MAG: hypothetical protein CVV25_07225 [Ignavibacteriae bacterium HGW-Ignavibacteriae-4]
MTVNKERYKMNMQKVVLSSIVCLLILICSSNHLYSQQKIFDFGRLNYLNNPNKSIIDGDLLVSLNSKSFLAPGESQFNNYLVRYSLIDGSIQESKPISLGLENESYFVKSMYKNGEDIVIVSKRLELIPNQVTLTKVSGHEIKVYHEKANSYYERILEDKYRPLIGNTFYKIDPTRFWGDVNYQIQKLYKISVDGDSLDKALVYNLKTQSQYTVDYVVYDDANYFTVLNIYNSLLFEEGVDDTLSKFEIYRINKFNLSVDTLIIENEFTYLSAKTFEVNNKFYVAFSKQDSSVKNVYLLDNKITIFEYDIDANKLEKVVDFEFKHKVELENIHYDKYTNRVYFYGNASTNKKTYADLTYSDYWLAEIDNNFNIKNEFSWSWSSLDRLKENIYNLNSDEEGLIISMGEYDITNSIPYKPYFFKMSRDLVTNIDEISDNSLFTVFPNPTSDLINLNSIELPYNLELYDYTGRRVIEQSGIYDKDLRIDIREFPQGIYTLKVESKGVNQSKNVIITK